MILPKLSGNIAYGGDYNPEQWPESVWIGDMELMRQAGVNLVSLGIFAWAKLQPAEDRWEFSWLDRVLELLAKNDIFVCLATATASPPPWLVKKHPSILPVTADGKTLYPGSRQHYSPSSARYREAAEELVSRIAARYKDHPALAAWHINNEYACHLHECHGAESTTAFRLWLKNKYGTLDALNEAWGTSFWSQIYSEWDEILTPRLAPYFTNPTQQLDFKRFTSDAFLELLLLEKRILRAATPDVPINTNFMGFFKPLDYHRWARELDFTSWDSYPDPVDEAAGRAVHAAGHDLTRSLKPDTPFVLMEQASSAVNWRDTNLPKRPGLMRLWSLQAVARGGDGVMFFQWRASRAGTEKFHSALVQHVGASDSRVFREAVALGRELGQLTAVCGSTIRPEAAILIDWHSWWSVEIDSRPGRIDYAAGARQIHAWFYANNIPVDFVSPGGNLSRYKLVVAPALYLLKKRDAEAIERFVDSGGSFFATYFSAIADENDHVQLGGYPAFLRKTLGLWIEEWCPYPEGRFNTMCFADGRAEVRCGHWGEVLHLETAEALATFGSDFFAGGPAFTRNSFGNGTAYYLATRPDAEGLGSILSEVCLRAGVRTLLAVPEGVEVSLRIKGEKRFLFLLNHNDAASLVDLREYPGKDLLTGEETRGHLSMPPLGAAVIQVQ